MKVRPRLLCLVLAACSLYLGACGNGSLSPRPINGALRLEAAATPEGARGKNASHYVEGVPPPLFSGSTIHIDPAGLRLIEGFEEVQKATYCQYYDIYGHVWTRGFGETDWNGRFPTSCITHAEAERNLKYLIEAQYMPAVRGLGVALTQHQVDALASFVWNLGPGSMRWSSLRYALQHHNPYPMLAYDRAGGVVLPGLATRRRAEVRFYLTADPRPVQFTAAQRAARRHRIAVLRRFQGHYGCSRRRHHHQRLGTRCRSWFAEGDRIHQELRRNHA